MDLLGGVVKYRNRILRIVCVPARDLVPHAANWRTHPEYQRQALLTVLERVGWVDVAVARERADGTLQIVDGHLRQGVAEDDPVPVVVTDLTEAEALEALATLDVTTTLAVPDAGRLRLVLQALKDDGVPLEDEGWPAFRLDQVLGGGFPPVLADTSGTPVPPAPGESPERTFEKKLNMFAGAKSVRTVSLLVPVRDRDEFKRLVARLGAAYGMEGTADVCREAVRREVEATCGGS